MATNSGINDKRKLGLIHPKGYSYCSVKPTKFFS